MATKMMIDCGKDMLKDEMLKMKFSIFRPKKDECNTCTVCKAGLIIQEEEYQIHIQSKGASRAQMNADIAFSQIRYSQAGSNDEHEPLMYPFRLAMFNFH